MNFPTFLYRYRPLNYSFSIEELSRAIFNQEFYHASPRSWNDPFDFRPIYENVNIATAAKALRDMDPKRGRYTRDDYAKFRGAPVSRSEFKPISKKQKNNYNLVKAHLAVSKKVIGGLPSKIVATCFSETPESVPMWAHYSGNHAGLCLELRFTVLDFLLPHEAFPLPVVYSEERPTLDFLDLATFTGRLSKKSSSTAEKKDILDSLFLTKGKDWSYEREWRTVMQDNQMPGYRYLRCLQVSRVFVGLRIDRADLDKVQGAVQGRVPVERAIISPNRFSIDFVA